MVAYDRAEFLDDRTRMNPNGADYVNNLCASEKIIRADLERGGKVTPLAPKTVHVKTSTS